MTATVASAGGAVTMIAFDAGGSIIDSASVERPPGVPADVSVQGEAIASVVLNGQERTTLHEICFGGSMSLNDLATSSRDVNLNEEANDDSANDDSETK